MLSSLQRAQSGYQQHDGSGDGKGSELSKQSKTVPSAALSKLIGSFFKD